MVNLLWLSPENGLYSRSSCSLFGFYFIVFGVFFKMVFLWVFFFFDHACRILDPQPGMNHAPRSESTGSLTTWQPRNSCLLKKIISIFMPSFIHFWLCWAFVAVLRLPLAAEHRRPVVAASLAAERSPVPQASGAAAAWLSRCCSQASEHRLSTWVPGHVGSSRTRDQTQITPLNWQADS